MIFFFVLHVTKDNICPVNNVVMSAKMNLYVKLWTGLLIYVM